MDVSTSSTPQTHVAAGDNVPQDSLLTPEGRGQPPAAVHDTEDQYQTIIKRLMEVGHLDQAPSKRLNDPRKTRKPTRARPASRGVSVSGPAQGGWRVSHFNAAIIAFTAVVMFGIWRITELLATYQVVHDDGRPAIYPQINYYNVPPDDVKRMLDIPGAVFH